MKVKVRTVSALAPLILLLFVLNVGEWSVSAAASACADVAGDDQIHRVPTFSLRDLRAHRRLDDLASVLGTTGLLAVTCLDDEDVEVDGGAGGDFAESRRSALDGLCSCAASTSSSSSSSNLPALLSVEGADSSQLSDGMTTRTTLATATVGVDAPMPLPRRDLDMHCGGGVAGSGRTSPVEGMEGLRDHVSRASVAFSSALDRLILSSATSSASSMEGEDRSGAGRPLLRTVRGATFDTVGSIVRASLNLEHFHVYSKDDPKEKEGGAAQEKGEEEDVAALDPHTDAGLFLAFVPARPCSTGGGPEPSPKVASNCEGEEDESFYVRDVDGRMKRAILPPNGVAIMLGAGAEYWLDSPELLPLKATRHAVKMKGGQSRSWYGMMHLVPQNAIVQEYPEVRTFADMRRSMVEAAGAGSRIRRFGEDDVGADLSTPSIGCGTTPPGEYVSRTSNRGDGSARTARRRSRRKLQMVPDGGACNNVTNFYCWMSCLDIPNADQAEGYVNEGQSLYCLDPARLASSGNRVSQAVIPCEGSDGTPGAAMNTNCMGSWQPTAPGVPSQHVIINSTNSNVEEPYCYGGTSMYMQGFQWIGSTCVIYLFPKWVLTTQAAFVGACFVTLAVAIALEGVIHARRKLVKAAPPGWRRLAASAIAYGVQLTLGYLIMLVVMIYSAPLFICVILGLMTGHVIFNLKTAKRRGDSNLVPEGCTPCCQNDLRTTGGGGNGRMEFHGNAAPTDAATEHDVDTAIFGMKSWVRDSARTSESTDQERQSSWSGPVDNSTPLQGPELTEQEGQSSCCGAVDNSTPLQGPKSSCCGAVDNSTPLADAPPSCCAGIDNTTKIKIKEVAQPACCAGNEQGATKQDPAPSCCAGVDDAV